jgi:hypothetical protein
MAALAIVISAISIAVSVATVAWNVKLDRQHARSIARIRSAR